jgi:hypothetical protein
MRAALPALKKKLRIAEPSATKPEKTSVTKTPAVQPAA